MSDKIKKDLRNEAYHYHVARLMVTWPALLPKLEKAINDGISRNTIIAIYKTTGISEEQIKHIKYACLWFESGYTLDDFML